MKQVLKTIAYWFAYCVWSVRGLFGGTKTVLILMYHSVERSAWKYGVAPEDFAEQIEFLAKHRHVVPLSEVVACVKGEKDLWDGSVALTFDDGYKDLMTEVLPLLKKYQMPATVFLTTDLSVMPAL